MRLGYVEQWALQQGLEQAAECHMDTIVQVRKRDLMSCFRFMEFLYFLHIFIILQYNLFYSSGPKASPHAEDTGESVSTRTDLLQAQLYTGLLWFRFRMYLSTFRCVYVMAVT